MGLELLIEIGMEEIPALFCQPVLVQIRSLMTGLLNSNRISFDSIQTLCTPRRLVLCAAGVAEKQSRQLIKTFGPPKRIAYDGSGNPTKAAIGFANNQGVTVSDLKIEDIPEKGEYIVVERETEGKETAQLLATIIPEFITRIGFPKSMRWGSGNLRFARPIHWILAVLGGEQISFSLEGIKSGKKTYGHRFFHPGPIEVKDFQSYLRLLEKAYVICDHRRRKELILSQARSQASKAGGVLKEDDSLLEEVTHLVEWPVALCGSFSKEYLALPQDVLVTTMRDNQKFFCIVDEKADLLPYFITISNSPSDDPGMIINGNERVLKARLSDAAFFLKEDMKSPLSNHVQGLRHVVFQDRLGSLYDKVVRIQGLCRYLVNHLDLPCFDKGQRGRLTETLERAALLCKCDLVTEMVGEFPELQGIMGREYALRSGEAEEVASAIYEHYLPRFSDDKLPKSLSGSILSIADKIDNIVGCFALDLIPTGSEDPHALRRQTQGIIQIIISNKLLFPWDGLIRKGIEILPTAFSAKINDLQQRCLSFLSQRLNNYFLAQGYNYDLLNAVLGSGNLHPIFVQKRLKALKTFRNEEVFDTLLTPFKRVINILPKGFSPGLTSDFDIEGGLTGKVAEEGNHLLGVDPDKFTEDAESVLYDRFKEVIKGLNKKIDQGDYLEALEAIATLREPIDIFFDKVLVMDKEEVLRKNRLALLSSIGQVFLRIADFSKIVQE